MKQQNTTTKLMVTILMATDQQEDAIDGHIYAALMTDQHLLNDGNLLQKYFAIKSKLITDKLIINTGKNTFTATDRGKKMIDEIKQLIKD